MTLSRFQNIKTTQKSILFIYTSNEQVATKIKKL